MLMAARDGPPPLGRQTMRTGAKNCSYHYKIRPKDDFSPQSQASLSELVEGRASVLARSG